MSCYIFDEARPRAVVFDLDGTLVDTAPDLTAALNHALGHIGRAPVAAETVRHLVGHGARALILRGLALQGGGTDAEVATALGAFLAFYQDHICVGSRPYPGLAPLLGGLKDAGIAMAVCTNKPVGLSRLLLDALCLSPFFPVVVGGDSLAVRKPDPAHLHASLAPLGVAPADAIMVGDTSVDVATARAAGVPVVAVRFGFADRPVDELGADCVIDHFDAAPAAFRALWDRPPARRSA